MGLSSFCRCCFILWLCFVYRLAKNTCITNSIEDRSSSSEAVWRRPWYILWQKLKIVWMSFKKKIKKIVAMGRSWVAVEQTLKFLPLARVRNDIVYEPEASRQCHSLQEQEEEISNACETATQEWHCQFYVKLLLNKSGTKPLSVFGFEAYFGSKLLILFCFPVFSWK